jgi:hypothetical protein
MNFGMFNITKRHETDQEVQGSLVGCFIMQGANGVPMPVHVALHVMAKPMPAGNNNMEPVSTLHSLESVLQQLPMPLCASHAVPLALPQNYMPLMHLHPQQQQQQQQQQEYMHSQEQSPMVHENSLPPHLAHRPYLQEDGFTTVDNQQQQQQQEYYQQQLFQGNDNHINMNSGMTTTAEQQPPPHQNETQEQYQEQTDNTTTTTTAASSYFDGIVSARVVCHVCGEAGHKRDECKFYKRQLCTFFNKLPVGCTRGARCWYAHGVHELRQIPADGVMQRCVLVTRNGNRSGEWKLRGCFGPHEHRDCPFLAETSVPEASSSSSSASEIPSSSDVSSAANNRTWSAVCRTSDN